jgi:hypothetical protein
MADLAEEIRVVPPPAASIARGAAKEFELARRNFENAKAMLVATLGYDVDVITKAGQRLDLIDGADGVMRLVVVPRDAPRIDPSAFGPPGVVK